MSAGAETDIERIIEAGRAKSGEEWLFLLVNRSVAVTGYDRASAWSTKGRPRLLAVSGTADPDPDGAFAAEKKSLLKTLPRLDRAASVSGQTALWIPVPARELGFLFERWDGAFDEGEGGRLERFVEACALAWSGAGRGAPPFRAGAGARTRRRLARLVLLLAVLAALAFVRIPLRIAAECEVVARNPRLVAAPMDGVIAEIVAVPGARAAPGDPLAVYDSRMMEEELNILRRQVEVAETELATARARGFSEQRFRADASLLEARLAQERARLRALEVRYAQRVIEAPVAGMIQIDDPRAWRGRPVATGEAILWLVEPSDTRLRIWLPQDDRIDFDAARPLGVHLYALGGEARAARLSYVSTFARPTGDGRYAFPAEAEWEGARAAPPLGLRGTAFLYGEEVSLGYWLLRRPLGWLRRWTGV